MAKQVINFDAQDIIHALQQFFAPIAHPPERRKDFDKKATKYNVEVMVGQNKKEGILKVKFFTESRFLVQLEMEVAKMLENHVEYMNGIMLDVAQVIDEGKRKRAQEKPIILLN